jgi:hypothetical protein
MLSLKPEERREDPRRRLGNLATMQFGNGIEPRLCLVTEVSDSGVRIDINGAAVPDDFVLLFPGDGSKHSGKYKVMWRLGQEIGAKFIGAA